MAETRSDKIQTVVAVTEAEMLNLLATQAQTAGFIDYAPDGAAINPTSISQPDIEGVPQPDIAGYEITFTGPRA
jgi:hypothetical protein